MPLTLNQMIASGPILPALLAGAPVLRWYRQVNRIRENQKKARTLNLCGTD